MEINSGLPFSPVVESTWQFPSEAVHCVRLFSERSESSRFAWIVTGTFDSIEAGHWCIGVLNTSENMETECLMRQTGEV